MAAIVKLFTIGFQVLDLTSGAGLSNYRKSVSAGLLLSVCLGTQEVAGILFPLYWIAEVLFSGRTETARRLCLLFRHCLFCVKNGQRSGVDGESGCSFSGLKHLWSNFSVWGRH